MICGKTIYLSRGNAQSAIDGQHNDKRKTKSNVKACYSYYCSDCDGYHITSNESKRKPKIKKSQNLTIETTLGLDIKRDNIHKSKTKNVIIHDLHKFKVK